MIGAAIIYRNGAFLYAWMAPVIADIQQLKRQMQQARDLAKESKQ